MSKDSNDNILKPVLDISESTDKGDRGIAQVDEKYLNWLFQQESIDRNFDKKLERVKKAFDLALELNQKINSISNEHFDVILMETLRYTIGLDE